MKNHPYHRYMLIIRGAKQTAKNILGKEACLIICIKSAYVVKDQLHSAMRLFIILESKGIITCSFCFNKSLRQSDGPTCLLFNVGLARASREVTPDDGDKMVQVVDLDGYCWALFHSSVMETFLAKQLRLEINM